MRIGKRDIGENQPTYFIADIAANHNGNLNKALELMTLAKAAGADAAKFQHFRADFIVSDYGFRELGAQQSHQASWKKSVYEIYKEASLPWKWTENLANHAQMLDLDFFTSPYDFGAVDFVDNYVPAFKVGSGDVNWLEIIEYMASKQKPMIIATGAATLSDIENAVDAISKYGVDFSVMQCNTNYTASAKNFSHINLRVLDTFGKRFPRAVLGLSDHTLGHTTVLGAVALGARIIEKHFTDNQNQEGPDHHFSMTPKTWSEMVLSTRELEKALGTGNKIVEDNEKETIVIQRRSLRFTKALKAGHVLSREDIIPLRPAPPGSLTPDQLDRVLGSKLRCDVRFHEAIYPETVVAQ